MKGIKITILSLIALLLLDACSIQSRRYRKGFHVESLAKRSKSSVVNTKEVNQLVKVASDKNEKQDLAPINSIAESEHPVSSKAISKKSSTGKTAYKIKLAKQYKTIKTFKKSLEDSLQKRNYPTLKTIPNSEGTHNKVAVGAFVLAMVSIFCTIITFAVPIFSLLAFLTALVSFILAIVALVQFKKDTRKGKGLAIAALVLCILYFLFFLLVLALIAAAI
jgi:ABC-type multidrug transport system fused ATPase/permease subunit